MEDNKLEDLKKIIKTLKVLDYTTEDIRRVLKIQDKDIKEIVKYFDII